MKEDLKDGEKIRLVEDYLAKAFKIDGNCKHIWSNSETASAKFRLTDTRKGIFTITLQFE